MAHKTFISYKYSKSQELRDKIVKSLGEDVKYYKGETNDSPDKDRDYKKSFKRYAFWHNSYNSYYIRRNLNGKKTSIF